MGARQGTVAHSEDEEGPSPPAKRQRTGDRDASEKEGQAATSDPSEQKPPDIDESLYSRQLYVLGREAMVRMAQSDVLISGMGGLGVEIAKNVILAGVRSVTIHDEAVCTLADLSSQYYLSERDVGHNRADACEPLLGRLNQYVQVKAHTEPLTEDFLKQFTVVVLTETPLETQQSIAAFTHENKIPVIVADTRGLAGQIFCDFGETFRVHDPNGEQPLSVMVQSISEKGEVKTLDKVRHGFEDGDYVKFSEVRGTPEINNCPPTEVKVLCPHTFSVKLATKFGEYAIGGVATEVKMPKDIKFDDAAVVVQLAKEKNALQANPLDKVDEKLLTTLSCVSAGSLCPMQAVIGSIAAQEVIKACSGKFTPIQQWFYFDAFECLPQEGEVPEVDAIAMEQTRYAGQARVFGTEVQDLLMAQTYFVVGAGAIGCELLKNFAMMGVGAADGCIHITDMDVIERSNLNRQFLFRSDDIGRMKSATAAEAVARMNPEINIEVHEDRVGPDTESVYNDHFFESLDGVANALDNLDARLYMDQRCVWFCKPLLESGVTGTKGNVQVVVPHMTESYSCSLDPPEASVPVCTIKNFPYTIEHTLQWARDEFEGLFRMSAVNAVEYLRDPDFLPGALQTMQLSQKVVLLEELKHILVDERPRVFDECVDFARLRFQEQYNTRIRKLLQAYPPEQLTSSFMPFWSGRRRCPHPIEFDPNNTLHMDYIVAAANLRATMFGIPNNTDRGAIAKILEEVDVPVYVPPKNAEVVANSNEPVVAPPDDNELLDKLQQELPARKDLDDLTLTPLEFEKDDDAHMDFIVAASNLRAANYDIQPADRLKSKLIAGKIVPAIATTASLVAGLACLELYKLVQGHDRLELYKNSFVNLALPFVGFSEPVPAAKKKFRDREYTFWDCLDIEGELTLAEFLDHFRNEFQVEVLYLSEGARMLYDAYAPPSRSRLNLAVSKVLEMVSRTEIDTGKRALMLQLMGNDVNTGEKVELPDVRYVLSK
ncbi:ubiquitin-like modifier-activating enzyme 1 isoform X2 [Dermacentor albipictus]|uniref:ubiquitin-like modifier-activating enzyme 1 isoform X2 n=1 Tax=Dermacentor albipictus TaxID=60249 RepID=UPI0031FC2E91